MKGGVPLQHKQVVAERLEALGTGTIDTIFFWVIPPEVEPPPAVRERIPLSLRLFKSNIRAGHDHGVYPNYNYLPWGYYINTNDLDQGITPYWDEATVPNWINTNEDSTWDPLGEELWGLGGFPIEIPSNLDSQLIAVGLEDLLGYKPWIRKGESFFICIRNERNHVDDPYFNLAATRSGDKAKPWQFWKFFEHENPFGTWVRPAGWVALGLQTDASIWYSMTLTFPPPIVLPPAAWLATGRFSHEDIQLELVKFCRPEFLDSADIGRVWLDYRFDGGPWDSLQAAIVGDTMFAATLPRQPAGTLVELQRRLYNQRDSLVSTTMHRFTVYGLSARGFTADTGAAFVWEELYSPEYELPYGRFFLPPGTDTNYFLPIDDGTAGPFDLGFDFDFLGSPARYAWIGINGGMALTASPTDTVHLNLYSAFAPWSIPGGPPAGPPKNFLAPFWNDLHFLSAWWKCDSGNIFVKRDSLMQRFTVEWYDLSSYQSDTDCTSRFQVVLDNSDTSVTFLYFDVGTSGLEKTALVGFQGDTSKWFVLCDRGEPAQYRPRTGQAIRFTHALPVGVGEFETKVPREFVLYQNYPNPFNSVTSLKFQVSGSGFVALKVYNVLGREVATLVNEIKPQGEYTIRWDASHQPSGVYYYRLVAGKQSAMGKAILIR